MKKHNRLFAVCLLTGSLAGTALGQNVGINTTGATPNAAAILDLNTGNTGTMGFLPEQVALTATNAAAPLTLPPTGLIVYNTATAGVSPHNVTPGYYFNAGTSGAPNWVQFVAGNSNSNNIGGWLLNGNAGTNPATNFVGTTDANALNFRTNNLQRMTILSTGLVGINIAAPPYLLTVTGGASAPIGYFSNSVNTGGGIWAANTAGAGASTGYGVAAYSLQTGSAGIAGQMSNATVTINTLSGVSGTCDASQAGYGVTGAANNASGTGVLGISSGSSGWGVVGLESSSGTATEGFNSGTGIGVFGYNTSTTNGAVEAKNTSATGTGIMACGNNSGLYYPGGVGAGGDFTGATMGIIGDANASTGYFNNSGVSGMGTTGVSGRGPGNYGGYFDDGTWYAYVGGSGYKILGNGIVSTIIQDQNHNNKALTCPEAPEVLFEDYGTAQLLNGKVHVNLDNLLAANVTINQQHPLRVMITLNDNCNGVYVTNRTATGFDVVELNNGTSNASFTYEVIANRAAVNGVDFADMRFPPAPGPMQIQTANKAQVNINIPHAPATTTVVEVPAPNH